MKFFKGSSTQSRSSTKKEEVPMFRKVVHSGCRALLVGLILGLLILEGAVSIRADHGGTLHAPSSVAWPMDGTPMASLFARVSEDPSKQKVDYEFNIRWNQAGIKTRVVLPTAKVIFGPFKLKLTDIYKPPTTATFIIRVYARSPTKPGTERNLVQIGSGGKTLTVDANSATAEEEVYVEATLPGVFNAVQLRAGIRIEGGGLPGSASSSFPKDCRNLPDPRTGEPKEDAACLQAAVNPLAVLVPRLVPITIIYEPPGNCSWAKLTNTHTAGTAVSVEESTATATKRQTLRDVSVLRFPIISGTTTSEEFKDDMASRTSQVWWSRSSTNGTILAPPSALDCKFTHELLAPEKRGPAKGDLFIFLVDPPMIYWDTENLSNFRFPRGDLRSGLGFTPTHAMAFAWQIASGEGLPPNSPLRELTDEQRKAILALDPFFVAPPGPKEEPPGPFGPFKEPKLPEKRFIHMENVCPSEGSWVEQTEKQQTIRKDGAGITAGEIEGKMSGKQLPEDPVIRYTIKALAFGGNLAAKRAAELALGRLLAKMGFRDIEKIVEDIAIPELLKIEYKTATTTTISYSRSKLIEKVEKTAITQHFFIQDTNRGMNVAIYYDTFFGTFAFAETPACKGLTKITVDLPIFTWPTTAKVNENVDQVLPKELADGLKSAGARLERGTISFEAAPASEYEVPGRFDKGLPPGLQLDLEIGKLSGKVLEGAGKTFQALFFVLNAQRERVAQLWITVEVVEAVTRGPLRVETSASAKQVCSPNFSHELAVSWKVTGGQLPVSVTIEITGPDGKTETIKDLPLEGERKFQLRYPGGGSVKIKVIAKDASGSSSSAQASVQLGKCQ